jgi:hypothetical protein
MEEEGSLLKIHDCSELPSLKNIGFDADCLDRISAAFKSWKWKGSGQYGFVIETMTAYGKPVKTESLVVKISAINTSELRVACELNSLTGETPVFPHTYGWVVCSKIPDDWLSLLKIHNRNHAILTNHFPQYFLFTFVQPAKEKWDEVTLAANNGYRVSLFFLLHGLYVARHRIGFNHGDIHSGNVMTEYHMEEATTTLRYGQYEAEVTTRYVPRLIDYGRSSTQKHNEQKGASDLKQLRKMFDERLEYDMDQGLLGADDEAIAFNQFVASVKWREVEESVDDSANAILMLLAHHYFEIPEISRHQVKRQSLEPIERCFSCCATNPEHQINHKVAAPKYFCGKRCYQKIHGICQFIK